MERLIREIYHFCKTSGAVLHKKTPELEGEYLKLVDRALAKLIQSEHRIAAKIGKTKAGKNILDFSSFSDNFVINITIKKDCKTHVVVNRIVQIKSTFDEGHINGKYSKGWVYVLECEYGYKIGCSSSLKNRVKLFEVKLPFPVYLHSKIKCGDWKTHEQNIHGLLSANRINGEWFKLCDADFLVIDNYCETNGIARVCESKKEAL